MFSVINSVYNEAANGQGRKYHKQNKKMMTNKRKYKIHYKKKESKKLYLCQIKFVCILVICAAKILMSLT